MSTPITGQPVRAPRWKLIGLVFFTLLFTLFVYTFLHEMGHALVGLAFGQTLTDFNLSFWDLSAHVGLSGELTPIQHALRSIAGVGFPLLVWTAFISLAPRRGSLGAQLLKLAATSSTLGSLLAWIFIPFFRLYGGSFASDDVTQFLRLSQMPPLLLAGLAASLFTLGWAFFLSRSGGLHSLFVSLRQADNADLNRGERTTVPAMAGILLACLAVTLAFTGLAAQNSPLQLNPPLGFQPLESIDLALQKDSPVTLTQFSLDQPAVVGVFFRLENIEAAYIYLHLMGGDGADFVLLHGEGYRAGRNTGLWQETLPPGDYRLVLDSRQSAGTLAVYLGYP